MVHCVSPFKRIKFYFSDLCYRRKYFLLWSLLLIVLFISTVICITKYNASKTERKECGIFGHGSFLNIDHDESHDESKPNPRHPVFVAYPEEKKEKEIVEKHGQWRIMNHTEDGAYANYNETFCNRVEPAVIGIQTDTKFLHLCCGGQNYHGYNSGYKLHLPTDTKTNDCEVRDLKKDYQNIKTRIQFEKMDDACRFFNPLGFTQDEDICNYRESSYSFGSETLLSRS